MVHLPQRIIIFPLHNILENFLIKIVNKYSEWDLLKNKKITGKEKYFKFFVEKEISDIITDIKIVYQNYNIKILTVYKDIIKTLSHLEEYYNDVDFVIKKIFKIFKNNCDTYFLGNVPESYFLNISNREYKGLRCVDFSGEETEFIIKITKKWTNM